MDKAAKTQDMNQRREKSLFFSCCCTPACTRPHRNSANDSAGSDKESRCRSRLRRMRASSVSEISLFNSFLPLFLTAFGCAGGREVTQREDGQETDREGYHIKRAAKKDSVRWYRVTLCGILDQGVGNAGLRRGPFPKAAADRPSNQTMTCRPNPAIRLVRCESAEYRI